MALLCIVAVYNEEALLGDCLDSIGGAGVDAVHVFDGAWRSGCNGGPGFAGARRANSTDRTERVARQRGATYHRRYKLWEHQGEKRTAMFHGCGAGPGDHLLIVDADERLVGRFPRYLPEGDLCVPLISVGANDLPDIRRAFPQGDYSAVLRPALRVFEWAEDLTCLAPGHYVSCGRVVRFWDGSKPLLPVVNQVRIEHHANLRDRRRLRAKRAYYKLDHPARRERVDTALALLPPPVKPPERDKRRHRRWLQARSAAPADAYRR